MMYKNKYSSGSANILYTCTYKSNSYKVVKCLIVAGADPNAVIEGQHGLTITAYASSGASDSTVIELLIEHGGNPFTPWYSNRFYGHTEKRSIVTDDLSYSTKNSVYTGLVNYYKNKNLTATDNLRLRDSYSRSGRTLTAIKKGTKVKVIDAYNMEIIDDIHSCWVKVEVLPGSVDSEGKRLADGTTGWCFLGYLE